MSDLTVAQRALVHLSFFRHHREAFEVPFGVTQQGIADALGLSRSHVALELKKLLEEGSLESRLAHVRGAKSRRKVYFPTPEGERRAASLRRRAAETEARWIGPDGEPGRGTGKALLRLCRRTGADPGEATLRVLAGEVVDLRQEEDEAEGGVGPEFVGRGAELERLRAWRADGPPVLVVTGIAGVGKTALLQAFLAEAEGVWVQVRAFHTPATLLTALANALARAGRSRLLSYLGGNPLDYGEVALLLARETTDLLLAVDDVTTSPQAAEVLSLLVENLAPGAKVVMTGREVPSFLRGEGAAPTETVVLEGLDLDATADLLDRLDAKGDAAALHAATGGHPLLLRWAVARDGPPSAEKAGVRLLADVLEGLLPEEEAALLQAGVFRRPVPPEALGIRRFRVYRSLLRKGLLTERGGRTALHDLVAPLVRKHGLTDERSAHRRAARFWEAEEAWVEAVHHRAAAGDRRRALETATTRLDAILERGEGPDLLAVLASLPEDPGRAYLQTRALDYLGRWEEAAEAAERGLQQATDAQERRALQVLRGRIHSKRGELRRAAEVFSEAAAPTETGGDERVRGEALYGLAIVRRKQGRMAEATSVLQEALALLEASGADRQVGRARMEMGVLQLQAREPDEAVAWFRRAEPLLAPRREDSAYLQNNLGIAHRERGDLRAAEEAFDTSVRLAEAAGLVRAEAHALANLADLYVVLEDLDRAEAACRESLETFRRLQDPLMIATCMANQAKVEGARDRFEEALALYEEGLATLRPVGAPYTEASILEEMAGLSRRMGDARRAEAFQQTARELRAGG